MEYHLRITVEREEARCIIGEFIKKFNPLLYIFAYEEKEDNHHIHGHVVYNGIDVPAKSTMSDWMGKQGFRGKYYHSNITKSPKQNILYVCKELDIITSNYPDEVLQQFKEETEEINRQKTMNQRHKLCELCIKRNCETMEEIRDTIIGHYINDLDKEPPMNHLSGYTMYIYYKINKEMLNSLLTTKKIQP